MLSGSCRRIEVRHADLGVTARWDGGVTVVLLDDASHVLGRMPVGEAATTAEVEAALRAMIRLETERHEVANLIERARRAIQQGWAVSGTASALIRRSRRLTEWSRKQRWTELEPGATHEESA